VVAKPEFKQSPQPAAAGFSHFGSLQIKNPLAHYSGVLSEAVQESAAANVPASEAVALCDQHLLVADVGGWSGSRVP